MWEERAWGSQIALMTDKACKGIIAVGGVTALTRCRLLVELISLAFSWRLKRAVPAQ